MLTFKILGMLIAYPREDMQAHMDELIKVIDDIFMCGYNRGGCFN